MKIEIIAELGQGYEGNYTQSLLLIKAASVSGADAAKFQLVYADELATPDYKYYDLFRSLEMEDDIWQQLADEASKLNVALYLDIFGTKSLNLAEKIGVKAIKLHGTDIANIGLLKETAESKINKIILGAGGAHLTEILQAIDILKNKEVIVLFGFQGYPTPNNTNNIQRVKLLKDSFEHKYPNVTIGFADHADPSNPLRYTLACTAIGAGARVIEKHLTLGRNMQMEDHESALNPDEFQEFSQIINDCFEAMGNSEMTDDFGMSEAEISYRKMIRRHVVAKNILVKGSRVVPADLSLKRTSSSDAITDLNFVYDNFVNREIQINTPVLQNDIK